MDHFKHRLYTQCHLSHFPATVCGHTSHLSYEKQKKGGRWGEEKGEKREGERERGRKDMKTCLSNFLLQRR